LSFESFSTFLAIIGNDFLRRFPGASSHSASKRVRLSSTNVKKILIGFVILFHYEKVVQLNILIFYICEGEFGMKQYTWYVNVVGQVQVYEGDINETLITDVYTLEDAMKDQSIKHEHHKLFHEKKYKGLRGLFNHEVTTRLIVDKVTYEERPQIKYWIPQEHAESFFFCIEEPNQLPMSSGVTTVNISEFLD